MRLDRAARLSEVQVVYFHAQRTGMADRLLGLTSAFLLAFTLDRALLVSFGEPADDIGMLFDSPGWDWTRRLDSFEDLAQAKVAKLDLSWKVFITSEQAVTVHCRNLSSFYADVDVIDVGSNEWWVPLLFSNGFHKHVPRILEAEPEQPESGKKRLFEIVSRFLLRPTQKLREKIQQLKAQHGSAEKVLSLHVRVGHSEMDMINKSGYIEGWYKPDVATFITCAEEVLTSWKAASPGSRFSVFIATDNLLAQDAVEKALASEDTSVIYFRKNFTKDGRLVSTNASKSLNEGQYTLEAFESAIVDYWLLGEADMMVASTMSSAASFAPGRRSISPIVATVDKQCIALPEHRTQPCMHLLAEDYRSPLLEEGDYATHSLCANADVPPALQNEWNVRRLSVYYHSEDIPYTCLSYDEPRLT